MDRVPYFDLHAQYDSIRTEVLAALEGICESTSFAQGPATADFEAKFAAYCGVDHCVSLKSGTSALHLPCAASTARAAADEIETTFMQRVEYVANLDSQYQRPLQTTRALQQVNAPQAHLSREPH